MELVDTHCHLDGFLEKNELDGVLDRAAQAGVVQMIAVSTQAQDAQAYAELAGAYPGRIFSTVGLHPCYVQNNFEAELLALEQLLKKAPAGLVAIGEIGLDYFHLPHEDAEAVHQLKQWQREAFLRQLDWALEAPRLPVIIHSRHAFYDCLELLKASGIDLKRVVFHCFSEGPQELLRLTQLGGRASFTGTLTYKNAEAVRQALLAQDLALLMLETDAPYLAPAPHRGKPNEPALLRYTAQAAADILKTPLATLAAQTTATARAFFQLFSGA